MNQIQNLIKQIELQKKKHSNATYISIALLHKDADELLKELKDAQDTK